MSFEPHERFKRTRQRADKFTPNSQHEIVQNAFAQVFEKAHQNLGEKASENTHRLLNECIDIQREWLHRNGGDLPPFEFTGEQILLAVLSGLKAAKSATLLDSHKDPNNNFQLTRESLLRRKAIMAQFNEDLHNSMFYSAGEVEERYEEFFRFTMTYLADQIGIDEVMSREGIESAVRGIGYEVAVHRALAYPSQIDEVPYIVRASSPEEDLWGSDLVIEYVKRAGRKSVAHIDIKTRAKYKKTVKDRGHVPGPALALGIVHDGKHDDEDFFIINGEHFGRLNGFSFSRDSQKKVRQLVKDRIFYRKTRDS